MTDIYIPNAEKTFSIDPETYQRFLESMEILESLDIGRYEFPNIVHPLSNSFVISRTIIRDTDKSEILYAIIENRIGYKDTYSTTRFIIVSNSDVYSINRSGFADPTSLADKNLNTEYFVTPQEAISISLGNIDPKQPQQDLNIISDLVRSFYELQELKEEIGVYDKC